MSGEFEVNMTGRVFYIKLPKGKKAYITYKIIDDKLQLISTYTPEEFRGKGLARRLVDYAVEYAANNNLLIEPICSYAVRYFIKNPDKRGLLAYEYREMDLEALFKKRLEEERGS
jgi:hypothetical protein